MNTKPIKKLYYSISEVAEMTRLKPYVLRYWETEFVEIHPAKNRAGNRIYKEKDIVLIKNIKELLYMKKYTIEGARNFLKQNIDTNAAEVENESSAQKDAAALINDIRSELEDVLELLDSNES